MVSIIFNDVFMKVKKHMQPYEGSIIYADIFCLENTIGFRLAARIGKGLNRFVS